MVVWPWELLCCALAMTTKTTAPTATATAAEDFFKVLISKMLILKMLIFENAHFENAHFQNFI